MGFYPHGQLPGGSGDFRGTYADAYRRYLLNRFLWVKNGESLQTSDSLTVRALEILNKGSTNENVDQLQRSTLSSGIVKSLEGGFRRGAVRPASFAATCIMRTHLERPRDIWARPHVPQGIGPRYPNERAQHAKLQRAEGERAIRHAPAVS